MHLRLAALLALGLGTLASAGGLEVTPVSVDLGNPAMTALVTLKNGGGESMRYQLEMMSWGEAPTGEMKLSPTQDVVFFPQLLTLGPGETRNVRVGITQPAGAQERTYRLFVQELPRPKPPGGKSQVQVLTRVGIPIFVVPAHAASKAALTPLQVKSGQARFGITNPGNTHAKPLKVVFTAVDADGNSVFQKDWNGWYVLAGGERDYTIQIPAKVCRHATSFRAEATGENLSLSETQQAEAGACGP